MKKSQKNALIGAALAGLIASGTVIASGNHNMNKEVKGECHGINSCKGSGACGGKDHSCAGKNSCKGKGFLSMTKKECEQKKGSFKKASM